ncbi:MAG TPA: sigma-70 family RNA polymerase sigma factor [Bryobacteraceae bacterium]|jgi:RNA polymerase sigma factor (TIGR02999 family)
MSVTESEGSPEGAITRCLKEWRGGDKDALSRLTTEVYSELRRIAGGIMTAESANRTIQPTALVHELYLHLPGVREFDWQSRAQFMRVAAKMMRNILVDHARMRQSAKRGSGAAPVTFEPGGNDPALGIDVLLVNNALERFAEEYPRHAQVVELRFFGGLTAEETLEALRVDGTESSLRTVERDWKFAKAWLQDALGPV